MHTPTTYHLPLLNMIIFLLMNFTVRNLFEAPVVSVFVFGLAFIYVLVGAEDTSREMITAAMISDGKQILNPASRYGRYVSNFTSSLFQNVDGSIIFHHITIRESLNCSTIEMIGKNVIVDNFSVPNSAHIDAWKNFYASHKGFPSHKLLVFQHDACIGRHNAANIILDHTKLMTEDIMYFGYCFKSYGIPKFLKRRKFLRYHPRVTGLAPHCLHAYGITIAGAIKLLNSVKDCGPPLDTQIAELANKGLLSFKFANISYAPEFTKAVFADHGVHLKEDEIDGIFPRITFDEPLSLPQPEGLACHDLGRQHSVFILLHGYWRRIPNVEMYDKLIGRAKNAVKVLTTWQLRHYPEGADLTDAEMSEVIALRIKNDAQIKAAILQL